MVAEMSSEARLVAVFGGSFNPPHVGHVLACAYLRATQAVDMVLVVPVFRHPFDKELVAFEDRRQMCELAMACLRGVEVSDIEQQLGGESRTLYTLETLREAHPTWALRLVIGSDVLADLPKWHRFDRIAELAPPIVLGRAGHPDDRAPVAVLPEVSSSEIRAALRAGRDERLSALLPAGVLRFIDVRGLYRGSS